MWQKTVAMSTEFLFNLSKKWVVSKDCKRMRSKVEVIFGDLQGVPIVVLNMTRSNTLLLS